MDNEQNLIAIIDDIENFVEEEGTAAFLDSGKVKVEKDVLMSMINHLRENVPNEIARGQEIMEDQQKIIDDAKAQAQQIIDDANAQADKTINDALAEASQMVEETEILQLAKRRASEIEAEANDYAEQTVSQAKADAKAYRLGAMQYTKDTVEGMANYMDSLRDAQNSIYSQLLSGIEKDIQEFQENARQVESQISKLERER